MLPSCPPASAAGRRRCGSRAASSPTSRSGRRREGSRWPHCRRLKSCRRCQRGSNRGPCQDFPRCSSCCRMHWRPGRPKQRQQQQATAKAAAAAVADHRLRLAAVQQRRRRQQQRSCGALSGRQQGSRCWSTCCESRSLCRTQPTHRGSRSCCFPVKITPSAAAAAVGFAVKSLAAAAVQFALKMPCRRTSPRTPQRPQTPAWPSEECGVTARDPRCSWCELSGAAGATAGLGVLSSRQVYAETMAAEAGRWGGRLPLLGASSVTAKAALAAMELNDFHRQLAGHIPQEGDAGTPAATRNTPAAAAAGSSSSTPGSRSRGEPVASASASFDEAPDGVSQWGYTDWPAGVPRRCSWRWRGALTDFCVVEPRNPKPGAPAIVLVHGFGAFGDQWRFNLAPLAEAGYRVEKAALQYSQNAWRDFIRDFLVCVVGSPAVLAGNSIGGFISASAAADYPSLVAGLALLNSAGSESRRGGHRMKRTSVQAVPATSSLKPTRRWPVTPGFTAADAAAAEQQTKKPPNPMVVRLTTAALMFYLQSSIAKQLKWLYPTNPANADAWLEQEIYRAACDSRSADVFASVFYLPKPRPLNYLVNELWRGPTAVIQGVLDPLNDAQARSDLLVAQCAPVGLRAWNIQAGHCPHDEQPEAVNAALLEFVEEMVMPGMQRSGSSGSSGSSSRAELAAAGAKAQ
ncbi:Alpha/Beta hydrolase protein [Scenedesmus sp. NREL 46B-D3]|nr:Alpha/Beta hydrolase protein [Scenedesmus sp. NREL 46B-D3]